MKKKPKNRLLLPGLFLLLLGIGNLVVGHYKSKEYREVLDALELHRSTPPLVNASPMRRIQMTAKLHNRVNARQRKAEGRLEFYSLVSYGGKIFVSISLVLLLMGNLFRVAGKMQETSET